MKINLQRIFLLGAVLLALLLLSELFPYLKRPISHYCEIINDKFCEGQDVELVGRFNDSRLMPELGYLFTPDVKTVENPLYIRAVRYTGVRLAAGKEHFYHEIPFGSKVKVRGNVTLIDKYRCSDSSYAVEHQSVCTSEGMRILVVPSAIVGIQSTEGESVKYSIFGKLKDFERTMQMKCSEPVSFCEDSEKENCYQISLSPSQCSAIENTSNMFLVSGYTADTSLKSVVPGQIFQISGVDYSSSLADSAIDILFDRNRGSVGGFAEYDKTGQRIVEATPGDKNTYFDLEKVIPTVQGAYYFDKNILFFIDRAQNKSQVAELDPTYFDTNYLVYDVLFSAELGKVALTAVKAISQVPLQNSQYLLKKYGFSFLEIDLSSGESNVIYSERLDGFMHLLGYDFYTGTGLISYTSDEEQTEPCRKTYYAQIAKGDSQKRPVGSLEIEGNKYCTQVMYKQLFVAPEGNYLALGSDFNPNVPTPRENKLLIWTLTKAGVSKIEYLAQPALLYNRNLAITDVTEAKMVLRDSNTYYNVWEFDRDNDEYSYANLTGTSHPSPSPETVSWPYFTNAKLLFEDGDRYYLFVHPDTEYQLYVVNKKTRESFLVGTFSATSKPLVVGGDLFILDRPLKSEE